MVYAGLGLVSLIVLVIMLAIGGMSSFGLDVDIDADIDIDGDVGGGDQGGPYSLPLLLRFLSAFGGIGALSVWLEVPSGFTPFIAAVGALIMAAILFFILQSFLKSFTSDSTVQIDALKGEKGTVSIPIEPGKEGQIVVVTAQRGRTLVAAISDRSIKKNTDVIVIETMGDVAKVMSRKDWRNRSRSAGGPMKRKGPG